MILRKPYAFLIRKFRLIHFIIFAMLLYVFIKSISIYSFFNDYAVKHYFTPVANLAKNYINSYIFIITILIFLLSAVVYYLLSIKKKSRKVYFFICFYYIILFIYFIYVNNIFIGLEDDILNTETVRAIRDISLITLIPQLLLLFIMFARALGFNVKQFEFKRDLEDLKIDAEDYEEVEVTLGKNNYKYARTFRKSLRYLKYFFLENKFFITILTSLTIIGLVIYFYVDVKVNNVVYYENQEVYINTLWYTVEGSYYTDKNINGIVINKDKYYVLVKTKIDNKSQNKYDLSRNLFRLEVNNNLLTPIFTLNQEFIDIGKVYTPMQISKESVEEVLVVFEINKNELKQEYTFKVKKNENTTTSQNGSLYENIIINPADINSNSDSKQYEIPCEIDFSSSNLGESKVTINNFEIGNSFKEKLEYCKDENCYLKTILIEPSENYSILKLDAIFNVDNDVYMSKYLSSVTDLVSYYGKIKYVYRNKTYENSLNKVANKNTNLSYSYFEIPNKVLSASNVELYLNIREKTYIILLK